MNNHQDLGKFVLRVMLGLLILLHGVAKITHGVAGIEGMLQAHGLPAMLAYGAYVGEVVAPLMLIAGFQTRLAAILVAVNMLFAIFLAHAGDVFALRRGAWAIELQALFLVGSVAVALLARPGSRG